MDHLLVQLVPLGIGAAISPFASAICITLLSTRKPLVNASAFVLGYGAVLALIGALAFVGFADGGSGSEEGSSAIKGTIDAAIGVLFLVLVLKMLLRAPDPNAPPPRWMAGIDSIGTGKALFFGVFSMATNVTSLPLYISGLKEIVTANIGTAGSIIVLALFMLLVVMELLVPIVVYAASPRRAGAILGATRRWLEKNNRVISILVFGVFGVLLLTRGITRLLG